MAYYITINNKKNRHLDITSLGEFQRLSKYKEGAYSLEEIDNFTSKFENEIELKHKLFNASLISADELSKKIEIRIKLNGKLEKVRHGLVYSNMKKYLDLQYLTSKLLVLSNDSEFINKLLDHHRGNYKQDGLRQINAIINPFKQGKRRKAFLAGHGIQQLLRRLAAQQPVKQRKHICSTRHQRGDNFFYLVVHRNTLLKSGIHGNTARFCTIPAYTKKARQVISRDVQ